MYDRSVGARNVKNYLRSFVEAVRRSEQKSKLLEESDGILLARTARAQSVESHVHLLVENDENATW